MKILEVIDSIFLALSKIALFIAMILITANAISRYILNDPIPGTLEFIEMYLLITMVFLSLSYTWKVRGFIAIDIFVNKLSMPFRNIIFYIILTLGILFFGLIGYQAMMSTIESYIYNERVSGLIPWPVYLSIIWVPIGTLIIVIRMISEMVLGTINLKSEGISANIFNLDEDPEEIDIEKTLL